MQKRFLRSHPARPGSALAAVMIVLMVMTILGSGLMSLTMNNVRLSDRQRRNAVAFNLAESGATRAGLWLKQQGLAGALPDAPVTWDDQALGGGAYDATLEPHPDNVDNYQKQFVITSVGTANGRSQTVQLTLREQSFGRYAYFTDSEVSSITGNPIWFKAGEVIDGPAHSNNHIETYNEGGTTVTAPTYFHMNYVGSTAPIFHAEVTSVADQILYNPGMPTTDADWKKIFRDGASGFKLNVSPIDLPLSNSVQRNAALVGVADPPSTPSYPTTNGVYVPSTGTATAGGLYIKGDADIDFQVYNGDQRIVIQQGSETTTITMNRTTGTTDVIKPDGTNVSYDGQPNGVLFCDGNITSLKGTIADNKVSGSTVTQRNAWTISTNGTASQDIKITHHLQYLTPPDKTKPYNDPINLKAGTLGIVAEDVSIEDAAPTNLKLHAVVLAGGKNTPGGTFSVKSWGSGSPRGNLNLVGGLIQKKRGPVGTFNATTGLQVTGYGKNYKYDPRMANNPPPFFPTTGRFDQISWKRLGD